MATWLHGLGQSIMGVEESWSTHNREREQHRKDPFKGLLPVTHSVKLGITIHSSQNFLNRNKSRGPSL